MARPALSRCRHAGSCRTPMIHGDAAAEWVRRLATPHCVPLAYRLRAEARRVAMSLRARCASGHKRLHESRRRAARRFVDAECSLVLPDAVTGPSLPARAIPSGAISTRLRANPMRLCDSLPMLYDDVSLRSIGLRGNSVNGSQAVSPFSTVEADTDSLSDWPSPREANRSLRLSA